MGAGEGKESKRDRREWARKKGYILIGDDKR